MQRGAQGPLRNAPATARPLPKPCLWMLPYKKHDPTKGTVISKRMPPSTIATSKETAKKVRLENHSGKCGKNNSFDSPGVPTSKPPKTPRPPDSHTRKQDEQKKGALFRLIPFAGEQPNPPHHKIQGMWRGRRGTSTLGDPRQVREFIGSLSATDGPLVQAIGPHSWNPSNGPAESIN